MAFKIIDTPSASNHHTPAVPVDADTKPRPHPYPKPGPARAGRVGTDGGQPAGAHVAPSGRKVWLGNK